jgi:hypothetical protein
MQSVELPPYHVHPPPALQATCKPMAPPALPLYAAFAAAKDSKWLTLEVCREFARNKCPRSENECRYAHPPPNVEIQNGRVVCCFDSIKGRCQRTNPPCKYLHPPQHLKEQLLQNGRNNLIRRNLQMNGAYIMPTTTVYPMYPPYIVQNAPSYYSPSMVGVVDTSSGASMPVSMNFQMGNSILPAPHPANPQSIDTCATSNEPSESSLEATSSSVCTTAALPGQYWTTPVVDSGSSTSASYYSPVIFQTINAMNGMIPMMKQQAMAESKNGMALYQCGVQCGGSAGIGTPYQQIALTSICQQQHCYQVPMAIAAPMSNNAVQRY